jgi:hypothetical protein
MASKNGLTPQTDDWDILADPPEVTLDTRDERKTARLSKTRAWKQIDQYLTDRQAAYGTALPGTNLSYRKGSEANWIVADCIIKELEALRQYVDTIANGVS